MFLFCRELGVNYEDNIIKTIQTSRQKPTFSDIHDAEATTLVLLCLSVSQCRRIVGL